MFTNLGLQLSLVGTVGITGSSNYVKSSGNYIYVASGKGGLKIIKMEKPNPTFANCSNMELTIKAGFNFKFQRSKIIFRFNSYQFNYDQFWWCFNSLWINISSKYIDFK